MLKKKNYIKELLLSNPTLLPIIERSKQEKHKVMRFYLYFGKNEHATFQRDLNNFNGLKYLE